jgi:hypothetical protein
MREDRNKVTTLIFIIISFSSLREHFKGAREIGKVRLNIVFMFKVPSSNANGTGTAAAVKGAGTALTAVPGASGFSAVGESQTNVPGNNGGMVFSNSNMPSSAATNMANRAMMLQAASQFQQLVFLKQQNLNQNASYPPPHFVSAAASPNKRPCPGTSGPRLQDTTQAQNKIDASALQTAPDASLLFINQRIARLFRVRSTNRQHTGGFINKLFFGTVVSQEPIKKQTTSNETSKDNGQGTATDDVPFTWHVLYDDGDEADYDFKTVKEATLLYAQNFDYDRRKVMITRSDTDEDYNNNEAEESTADEDEDFVPTSLSSTFAATTQKKQGRPSKKTKKATAPAPSLQPVARPPVAPSTSQMPPLPPQAFTLPSLPPLMMQAAMFTPVFPFPPYTTALPGLPSAATQAAALPPPPPSQKPAMSKPKAETTRVKPQEVWSGPPDEFLEGGWPPGWFKRTFSRMSSAKAHTDSYWYSPKEKYKLRSMKEVRRFMDALRVENGDEKEAWKRFKGRKT